MVYVATFIPVAAYVRAPPFFCSMRVRELVLRRACTAMLLTVSTCIDVEVRKSFPTCTHERARACTHARTHRRVQTGYLWEI